jgi:hypothetical protein
MSANTGTAFCRTIAAALADIVNGETMTSSPGPSPAAATATCSPVVAELTVTACAQPSRSANARSHAWTCAPPSKPSG